MKKHFLILYILFTSSLFSIEVRPTGTNYSFAHGLLGGGAGIIGGFLVGYSTSDCQDNPESSSWFKCDAIKIFEGAVGGVIGYNLLIPIGTQINSKDFYLKKQFYISTLVSYLGSYSLLMFIKNMNDDNKKYSQHLLPVAVFVTIPLPHLLTYAGWKIGGLF